MKSLHDHQERDLILNYAHVGPWYGAPLQSHVKFDWADMHVLVSGLGLCRIRSQQHRSSRYAHAHLSRQPQCGNTEMIDKLDNIWTHNATTTIRCHLAELSPYRSGFERIFIATYAHTLQGGHGQFETNIRITAESQTEHENICVHISVTITHTGPLPEWRSPLCTHSLAAFTHLLTPSQLTHRLFARQQVRFD